ncbi:MAG: 3-phosphoshikimate 1-carboxyvinyltransferase [Clostridia bacterium]|nr:3-phosphoshikimate 1-carboxyvinyltransferase [Clostridia bacterium]
MRVKIEPRRATGRIVAPTSKSIAHRMLICASLCEGESHISGITECADVIATRECLRALGVKIDIDSHGVYTVRGINIRGAFPRESLFANESGSTLRFLIPICAMAAAPVTLTGSEKLLSRPLSVYEKLFSDEGLSFVRADGGITVGGGFHSGEYTVRGDISSQFITGLLFALSLCEGRSIIHLIPPVESRSYIDLTLDAMQLFGIHARFLDQFTIGIESGRYQPREVTVEGDYSASAFLEALNLLGGEVEVLGMNENTKQGDSVYRKIFPKINAGFVTEDISDCPDLAPILFALSAARHGGRFLGTDRLKIKESDRAEAMRSELLKLGAELTVGDNEVTVAGSALHAPTSPICSHNDHRIVMAMATLLTQVGGEIEGAEAVAKSYPDYFSHLRALGIKVIEYDTDK